MTTKEVISQENKDLCVQDKPAKYKLRPFFKQDAGGYEKWAGLTYEGETIDFTSEVIAKLADNPKVLKTSTDKLEEVSDDYKKITGLSNVVEAITFLIDTAKALKQSSLEASYYQLVSFLEEMKPTDHVEARLLAQFLVLNETANKLMRYGKDADMMHHGDFYYRNSMKAMNLSQQNIQTLIKYKSKGTQQINIVHMHDNAKAVIAGGGGQA